MESLANLCGAEGTELLVTLLNRGANKGGFQLIKEVKNPVVEAFPKEIMFKYGANYQWFLEPYEKDWERFNISTSYAGFPPEPVISVKIITKSGQLLELESPLPAYGKLVEAYIQHLKKLKNKWKKWAIPKLFKRLWEKNSWKKSKKL